MQNIRLCLVQSFVEGLHKLWREAVLAEVHVDHHARAYLLHFHCLSELGRSKVVHIRLTQRTMASIHEDLLHKIKKLEVSWALIWMFPLL